MEIRLEYMAKMFINMHLLLFLATSNKNVNILSIAFKSLYGKQWLIYTPSKEGTQFTLFHTPFI